MAKERSLLRGLVAGVVGGLAASWVMNEFIAGPGSGLKTAIMQAQGEQPAGESNEPDSTAKVADTLAAVATGGQHLTYEQMQKGGSVVHYGFGAAVGGLYGAVAEYVPGIKAGFGATYATALFTAADVVAVPTLNLSKPATEQGAASLAEYYAAHLVYGVSMEAVRRLMRLML